jgi:hypothetical protein
MGQGKPTQATTHESNLTSVISGLQTVIADPSAIRWYADRDIKLFDLQTFLAACKNFQALLTGAGLKTVV